MNDKKKTKELIPIFFATDDNYVPFLCVALNSLIANSSPKYDYKVHVLIDTLSNENKKILCDMQTENVRVDFYSVADKLRGICERLHMRDYYTKATYYRFFVPEMFPEYDRGVYLDCDIVITDDIAKLYHAPLGKNLVAAVPDEVITDIEVFAQYSEKVLGIPRNEYFNAGILTLNLAEMRNVKIEEQFASLLGKRTYRVAQDQDYLNVICYRKTTLLATKWNKTPMPDSNRRMIPKIAHYKINFKPWRYDNIPYAELFWKYAENTHFYADLLNQKATYTAEEKLRDSMQYEGLVNLAISEVESMGAAALPAENLIFAEV
ncbi:MAG: glycosyltransferase family 8 protein [Clostridia bacterium]|nr:glycosyltransferase family 8 protein [Clostridia bacterium]